MKIIFLDIDGVLNSWRYYKSIVASGRRITRAHADHFDPKAVKVLNEILEKSGAKIVVSSTWRLKYEDYEANPLVRIDMAKVLREQGVVGEVIGITPRLGLRGTEIQAWLDENPGIESFVILDDDSDMGHLMPKLVLTHIKDGLRRRHIEPILHVLG